MPAPAPHSLGTQSVPSGPAVVARPQPRQLRLLPYVEDRAFLAAAVEIIETPPSPVRMAMLVTICAFVTAALVWSWFGRIDIHAVARGKVEPVGHVKVVQPLETGRVTDILVAEGQHVSVGQVLLVLDGREIEADLRAATQDYWAASAEVLRREAAIAAVQGGRFVAAPMVWPSDIPVALREREEAVLLGDLSELSATVANLDAQEAEKAASVTQLAMSIAAGQLVMAREAERVQLRDVLASEGNGSRLNLLDAQQSLLETRTQVEGDVGRKGEAAASIITVRSDRTKSIEAFLADNLRKLADARRTADEKGQARAKAAAQLEHMRLTAPVDGEVQTLSVTNAGQVVSSGQEVMRIVPSGGEVQIEAYVTNDDVGFVEPGQSAVIKVDAFPFTRYGTVMAEVVSVAHDAVPADAANQALDDATRQSDPAARALTPQAKPMTDLVFLARLRPLMEASGLANGVKLLPGMTVTAEVKTGSRRVLDYVLSPVGEALSQAARER